MTISSANFRIVIVRANGLEYIEGDMFTVINRFLELFPEVRTNSWHRDCDLSFLTDRLNDLGEGCEALILNDGGDLNENKEGICGPNEHPVQVDRGIPVAPKQENINAELIDGVGALRIFSFVRLVVR